MAKNKKTKEDYYLASQWTLMARKLRKHKLAQVSLIILLVLYLGALFADFLAPYGLDEFDGLYRNSAPTKIYTIFEDQHVGPHVYKLEKTIDKKTFEVRLDNDLSEYYKIEWFVHGTEYKIFGLIPCDLHLFGVGQGSNGGTGAKIFLFGADSLGRDIFPECFWDQEYLFQSHLPAPSSVSSWELQLVLSQDILAALLIS